MKPIKEFTIGSSVFFSDFPDYKSHDVDKLCIMDRFIPKNTNVLNLKLNGKDVFFFRNMSKEEFIKDTLDSGVPMRVGKFLVPEFADYLGFTIEDLKQIGFLFDRLDNKHEYEKIIYSFYLDNNKFYLTSEQKNIAYKSYKEQRNEYYAIY